MISTKGNRQGQGLTLCHDRCAAGALVDQHGRGLMPSATRLGRFAASPWLCKLETNRHGSILLVVLVIVAMLSLGAYTFSEMMVSEAEATAMFGRQVQSRMLADSGVETVLSLLSVPPDVAEVDFYHDPLRFQNVLVQDAETERGRGLFSVIAPVENDPLAQAIRFGLIDESSRLDVNQIVQFGLDATAERAMLMGLPNMTEELADAILDWIDEDDEAREFGAESDYYLSLVPPYEVKNGPLDSLDELLLVAGVTPDLVYGEDTNRNGLLDPNEDDLDLRLPDDNGDGVLQLGWNAYLTTYSREKNARLDGSPRIYVNDSDLGALYDQIEEEFGEETARFVVAYRLYGPVNSSGATNSSGSGSSSGSSGSVASSSSSQQAQQQASQAGRSVGQAVFGSGGQSGNVTRGGMDLSSGAKQEVKSLFDLVGAQVQAQVNGTQTLLESPWSSDPGEMQDYLPTFLDTYSTTGEEFRAGRVNVNQARSEVLLGVPRMTEDLAGAIADARPVGADGQPLADTTGARSTVGWLLIEGLVDLSQMRQLEPYLTTRGDVYRVQVLGYFEQGSPITRLEALIDATQNPPRLVSLNELNDLGKGYSRRNLMGEQ